MKSVCKMLGVLALTGCVAGAARGADPNYKNFRVAIYVTRSTVAQWANPTALAQAYDAMNRQVKFDKVYLEVASSRTTEKEETFDAIKKFFTDKGVIVSSAVAFAAGGQERDSAGGTLSYSQPADRAYVKQVAEMCARHFDEIILDDWFFTASKTAEEIKAKGDKTWTQYRTGILDEAAQTMLIQPAKAINPKFRLIIKYPNWYEHYQGTGYDLEVEPKIFDAIYTGVETRDPITWEQHLQQYESYSLVRYLDNVKPGGNDGAWVDQLGTNYIDRYAEQIWDLALAKPREVTLWEWPGALRGINVGNRPWQNQETSLNYQKMVAAFEATNGPATAPPAAEVPAAPGGRGAGRGGGGPVNGPATGYVAYTALRQMDAILGKLGKPIGVTAYRPPHAIGEEFYYDFLGMAGVPIEMSATFPPAGGGANVCLLTEAAKNDPDIVKKIKTVLGQGKNVVITSGLLRALTGKGIEEISEFEYTDMKVAATQFQARKGQVIANSTVDPPIIFPIVHFLTNQSWNQVNAYESKSPANAYPIVISDIYDKGWIYVLALPDNIADLYRLPPTVLNAIRNQILGGFPIRLTDAPAQVSLFAYDNNAFVVQSFLPTETTVTVTLAGNAGAITDLVTNQSVARAAAPAPSGRGGGPGGRGGGAPAGASFSITVPAHSYRAFAAQN